MELVQENRELYESNLKHAKQAALAELNPLTKSSLRRVLKKIGQANLNHEEIFEVIANMWSEIKTIDLAPRDLGSLHSYLKHFEDKKITKSMIKDIESIFN